MICFLGHGAIITQRHLYSSLWYFPHVLSWLDGSPRFVHNNISEHEDFCWSQKLQSIFDPRQVFVVIGLSNQVISIDIVIIMWTFYSLPSSCSSEMYPARIRWTFNRTIFWRNSESLPASEPTSGYEVAFAGHKPNIGFSAGMAEAGDSSMRKPDRNWLQNWITFIT